MELEGDRGGSAIIRRHENDLVLLETTAEQLYDVDTAAALELLKQHT
jgi:CTP:molybdopterin cytidylyltransferase MocA